MATVRMAFTFMQQALFATALCMAFALIGFEAAAQTSPSGRVEILNADRLDFDDHLAPGAQRLIGNVRLKHVDALMFCDSAYLYPDQHVRAYGHVAIRQGDTLDLKADRLDYTGEKRVATVAGKVVLSDPGMTLTTEALTYDLTASRATYTDSARIESRRDGNTLTSRNGTYLTALHRFIFSGNVRIEHPERLITADTLQYATGTGVADFIGPTHITQNETHMYCERGTYDTRNNTGRFTRAGRITTQGRTLTGDSLLYDRTAGIGSGWGNVQVADSANDILVRGNRGIYHEKQGSSMITGRAELLMPMNGDTLFLHADTLFASTDNVQGRNVTARRNVRFFKSDMQGTCDTMRYNTSDSLVRLRGNPMLWSATDQLTGDSMRLAIADGSPTFRDRGRQRIHGFPGGQFALESSSRHSDHRCVPRQRTRASNRGRQCANGLFRPRRQGKGRAAHQPEPRRLCPAGAGLGQWSSAFCKLHHPTRSHAMATGKGPAGRGEARRLFVATGGPTNRSRGYFPRRGNEESISRP
jgi:lipopolysaccharide export system protein LptA